METEKLQINLGAGVTKAEVILREGMAVKELEPKAPIRTEISGVIGAPVEYLRKRLGTGQFTQERSVVLVDRENMKISLIINEDDEYTRGRIVGELKLSPEFEKFGINLEKVWTPMELGMFFKMNRSFFPDKKTNMALVSELMNFTATVNNAISRNVKENGDRSDNFTQIVNTNLPPVFTIVIPIFKGEGLHTIEVETFAKIDGRDVSFVLISPGANEIMEDVRNTAINDEIHEIETMAPNIAIIEV